MPDSERITLIIDGNNLAYYLYNILAGQALTEADVFRLTIQLSSYAGQIQPAVAIELCFDPMPPEKKPSDLPWVRCLVAPVNSSADDLLRDRFRFHYHHGNRSVVITNDEEVLESVIDEGGQGLPAHIFTRRAGKSPVFLSPDAFQTAARKQAVKPKSRTPELDWDRLRQNEVISPPTVLATRNKTALPVDLPPLPEYSPPPELDSEPAPAALPPPEPAFRLTFESWPLQEGLHFLLDSFCEDHRQDEVLLLYQSLPAGEVKPADLRDLAILLRRRCGAEAGFAKQGALMKRVRLALIQSDTFTLRASELIAITGLKAIGLKGRIRKKAAPWLEIIEPDE